MTAVSPDLLKAAVSATRSALAELDPDEIPGGLRKVAAQTGRRLPPPLVRRVLAELESEEWLRAKAAEHLPETDDADGRTEAASLFLRRPDGWESRLAELDAASREDTAASERRTLERRVAALEAELDTSRSRVKRAQREIEMAQQEAEKRVTAARTSARAGRAGDRDQIDILKRENAALHAQLSALERDLTETKSRLTRIRSELLKERRTDRPAEAPPPASVWSDLDGVSAARLLDEVSMALAPPSEFADQPPLFEAEPRRLPAGVAPDDRAAIDWLLGDGTPFVLLVDGYNVTFQLGADSFSTPDQRRRLETDLARMRRLSAARPRVVIVYDSDQPGGITAEPGPGGVERRFTTTGHTADDELLVLATELGGSAVVISSDRRVREGAERVGALGLWSQALVGWIKG